MKKHFLLAASLLAVASLHSCFKTADQEIGLGSPMPSADLAMTANSVDASKGGKLTFPSGTVVEIPENAFVDENGNAIEGMVDIDYREFHDMGAVLASGIPMAYNENGQKGNFETAGMFEIRGYQRGTDNMQLFGARKERKKAFVAKGKSLTVNMASFNGEENFNFYFFNEETQQWEYLTPSAAQPNAVKIAKLDQIAPLPTEKPFEPLPFDENTPVFDFNIDTKEFPELRSFKGIMWQYAGTDAAQDPTQPQNSWVGKTVWTDMKLQATDGDTYQLTLKNKSKSFEMTVRPVLRGKDYEKAKAKFDETLATYNAAQAKRREAADAIASEASFVRVAGINSFGLFNHDILMRLEEPITSNASFQLSDGEAFAGNSVYVLARKNKGMIQYTRGEWGNFTFPKNDAVIVAVMADGKIGVVSKNTLAQAQVGEKHTFVLEVVEGLDSYTDLSSAVSGLWSR